MPSSQEAPLLHRTSRDNDADSIEGYGSSARHGVVSDASSPSGGFERNLGAFEAFGIVISIVIGSGVFTSPGAIDTNVPSPGAALLVWLVGGILAWTGAVTFAELGTAIPGEGGVQPYLRHIYGELPAFLAAWTWTVAVMPATLAILSLVFVETAFSAAGVTDKADLVSHKFLAILILVIMSTANCISTKASTKLNGFFVGIKFVAILGVVVAGLAVVGISLGGDEHGKHVGGGDWDKRNWFGQRTSLNPDGSETHWGKLSQWEMLGHYSAALYAALWAYSGWDKAVYVSAELQKPEKQLPLAINSALSTTIICFLAANAAFYVLLPWKVVASTDSVAVTAITRLLGRVPGILAAVIICIVVAGSLLGNSFVASRMTVAASRNAWLPRVFTLVGHFGPVTPSKTVSRDEDEEASTASSSDAPINAVALSAILASAYILLGNFRALLTLNGLGEYTFFLLAVLGAVILRYREPELVRPYRAFVGWMLIFVIVSAFVVIRGAIFAPVQAGVLVGIWAVGLIWYYIKNRFLGTQA